ncbi:MAG: helix-hairpin-helix domain-containing protein [Desulfovibrio sp.]|uniref:helix-hairpin-helix domain-containing protein n=1 Tax=Desulfovibrio sp. TaxID=885 RepID=UPI00258976B6|nr:helix-hairpin-helix domain-containing protein [Desulfovibrio sp.]MCD7984640.1 helix-hairpin-helix domain-containing protein [Desulfovibrio sp.]
MNPRATAKTRSLADLKSVGKASLADFRLLGVDSVAALADADPRELYERLCRLQGVTVDICQYDLFCCAVAQARDPHLPPEQRDWFWWSRRRKTRNATGAGGAED